MLLLIGYGKTIIESPGCINQKGFFLYLFHHSFSLFIKHPFSPVVVCRRIMWSFAETAGLCRSTCLRGSRGEKKMCEGVGSGSTVEVVHGSWYWDSHIYMKQICLLYSYYCYIYYQSVETYLHKLEPYPEDVVATPQAAHNSQAENSEEFSNRTRRCYPWELILVSHEGSWGS